MNRIVCSSPDSDAVWSNLVYVNTEDKELLPNGSLPTSTNYISINNVVFKVVGDAKIDMHKVGLNAWQRTSAEGDIGQQVEIQTHPGIRVKDQLYSLEVTVDLLKKKRTSLEEKDVAKRFARVFAGQYFTCGQQIGARFGDNMVLFTVTRCLSFGTKEEGSEHGDGISLGADVKMGCLCEKTSIEVMAAENRLLDFTAAKKSAGVIRRNWRFEDMGIGGLDLQFGEILRRAFASRLFPQEVIDQLGIRHVKGMLLYGPPGTGKTLIARQIGKMIDEDGPEPQVVNGPEVLNKFVGKSEENIRNLFKAAEEDYAENKENAQLHVIIFDEIDAICKQRGSNRGGTGVHDTIVNQILTKLDGVNSINNILVIGMTNRKDMIDSALLRPGRLEVHMEISLPDQKGREQIFRIHTKTMRENKRLCEDVDIEVLAERTKNYSGAEIEGLVKAATSSAMEPALDRTGGGVQVNQELAATLQVRMEDFLCAIEDCPPAFGVDDTSLDNCLRGGFFNWGPEMTRFMDDCAAFCRQVETSSRTNLLSVLLEGSSGSGKTAIAARLALDSGFPFVKLISPEDFVGDSEVNKSQRIAKIFDDALRSPLSMIILDNIERLLEYVPNGPRFSTSVLQTLLTLLKTAPKEEGKKLLIVSTTSKLSMCDQLDLRQAFDVIKHVPRLSRPEQISGILEELKANPTDEHKERILKVIPLPIGIKKLLLVTEMAKQDVDRVTADKFEQCLTACGLIGLDDYLKGL